MLELTSTPTKPILTTALRWDPMTHSRSIQHRLSLTSPLPNISSMARPCTTTTLTPSLTIYPSMLLVLHTKM